MCGILLLQRHFYSYSDNMSDNQCGNKHGPREPSAAGKPWSSGQCRLCFLAVNPQEAFVSSVHVTPITVKKCRYLGDALTGRERNEAGLSHAKEWHPCGHKETPLGKYVCTCGGCGVNCRGFLAEEI